MRKFTVGCAFKFLVPVFLLMVVYLHFGNSIKTLLGRGVVVEVACSVDVNVSGRSVRCPCYLLDKFTVPQQVACQRAFHIGTNSMSVVVFVPDLGHLYWLDGGNIGITQYANNEVWFSRWLLLSEVALNCTYDVRDDMKGLDAQVECEENAETVKYVLKIEDNDARHLTTVEMEIDKKWLEKARPEGHMKRTVPSE